jgi:hypothetical protein
MPNDGQRIGIRLATFGDARLGQYIREVGARVNRP